MEAIFLNVMHAVSDSRFWLMPLLVLCIFTILVCVIFEAFEGIQEELDELASWFGLKGNERDHQQTESVIQNR